MVMLRACKRTKNFNALIKSSKKMRNLCETILCSNQKRIARLDYRSLFPDRFIIKIVLDQ